MFASAPEPGQSSYNAVCNQLAQTFASGTQPHHIHTTAQPHGTSSCPRDFSKSTLGSSEMWCATRRRRLVRSSAIYLSVYKSGARALYREMYILPIPFGGEHHKPCTDDERATTTGRPCRNLYAGQTVCIRKRTHCMSDFRAQLFVRTQHIDRSRRSFAKTIGSSRNRTAHNLDTRSAHSSLTSKCSVVSSVESKARFVCGGVAVRSRLKTARQQAKGKTAPSSRALAL